MQLKLFIVICGFSIFCTIQLVLYVSVFSSVENKERIILWWTPFMMDQRKSITCNKYKCLITDDRIYYNHTDLGAYLFYGTNLKVYDLPLPKSNTLWAIYHEESPKNLAFLVYKESQSLFDILATFDRYSHFPLTLQYLYSIHSLIDLTYFVPLEIKNKKDIAPVLYIQSGCETPMQRDLYVEELMKYISVDSYGACVNNKKLPEQFRLNGAYDVYDEEFMHFVAQYKFTIAIENAACNDYVTEKLWRPLIVGSIPIYLGATTVKDWLPNRKSAILVDEFETMSELAEYIHMLNSDDEKYNEYLQHKLRQKVTNKLLLDTLQKRKTAIEDFECFVCNNINSGENSKKSIINLFDCPKPKDNFNVDNTWKQHWDIGRCQAKMLDDILANSTYLRNYTEDAFDKLVLHKLMNNEC